MKRMYLAGRLGQHLLVLRHCPLVIARFMKGDAFLDQLLLVGRRRSGYSLGLRELLAAEHRQGQRDDDSEGTDNQSQHASAR